MVPRLPHTASYYVICHTYTTQQRSDLWPWASEQKTVDDSFATITDPMNVRIIELTRLMVVFVSE